MKDDVIYRQAAIDAAIDAVDEWDGGYCPARGAVIGEAIRKLPSVQTEPLTDKEQRIFLAAMSREEKVCKQVDVEYRDCRESYEDSLVSICHEITRKVKGALWT